MLKRYLVFAGSDYYPSGGWDDLKGSCDTIEEAKALVGLRTDLRQYKDGLEDWVQIVDSTTGQEIERIIGDPGEDVDAQMDAQAELESSPPPNPERIAELRAKLDAVKPEPQGLNAALVARAFEVMLPGHKASLTLTHNDHLNNYETVKEEVEQDERNDSATRYYNFVSPVERQKAIETNELWSLHWYPQTPIGFNVIHAATLPAIAQWLEDNGLAFGS